MSDQYKKQLNCALAAALEAGEAVKKFRSRGFDTSLKRPRDLLTSADLEAERIIIEKIRAEFPHDEILSEEASPSVRAFKAYQGPLWVIDPIDGTMNFAHNHHQVGISIGYIQEGRSVVGVVHSPFQNETFHAHVDGGAYLNGNRISVSQPANLLSSLIATGFPTLRDDISPLMRRIQVVLKNCRDIRRLGAASLDICWVAAGRIDGFYESLNIWDIAAGLVIAREAGAQIGHTAAVPPDFIGIEECWAEELIVAPPSIFNQLKMLLENA